jgi:polyphosphate kinase
MMAKRDLFELAGLDFPELHDKPHRPGDHPLLGNDRRNIFHIIRENGPLLLQHPYESFSTTVERFLSTAAKDPKVLAIKMTLYRTSGGAILDSLITAAQNGKQVAVLVELKARFDEAANIGWARRLEAEGIHVTYGVMGLKTHSKLIFVVRRDYSQLRRYYHIGTGNYHGGTAKLYTDLGMLGCDEDIGQDLTELFNYLTGYSPPPSYRKILAAPYTLKRGILAKIEREISLHEEQGGGHIQMKMNALEDPDIVRAPLQGQPRRRQARPDRPRHLPLPPRHPGPERERPRHQHRRPLPGARAHPVLPQRRRRGVLHRLRGHDAPQPGEPRRGPRPGGEPGAAPGAAADPRRAARRPALRLGHGLRRPLHPAQPADDKAKGAQQTLIGVADKRLAAAAKHKEKTLRSRLLSHFEHRLADVRILRGHLERASAARGSSSPARSRASPAARPGAGTGCCGSSPGCSSPSARPLPASSRCRPAVCSPPVAARRASTAG